MDEFMDMVWDSIVVWVGHIATMLDSILAPLNHRIGPAMVIMTLVVLVVALTKLLAKVYNTKRYLELKENYERWFELRKEATTCEDREKGKALARNIDQAHLNKAYYDYFFEGFLKSIITSILPILLTAAYINRAYSPENLTHLFGRTYIFYFSRSDGDPVIISSFFWFVISLFLVYLAWFATGIIIKKCVRKKKKRPVDSGTEVTPADGPEG